MSEATTQSIIVVPVLTTVPEGLTVVPVLDESNAPYLIPGDWVAVDPNVSQLEFGSLYCIRDPFKSARIYEVRKPSAMWQRLRDKPAVVLAPLNKEAWQDPGHRPGPALVEWIMDNIVGKVMGIYEPSLVPAAFLTAVRD